ncbi:hypothetical protein K3495_g5576 [Podosphaera aphanis]|nr:hypothetical protein K3495_g5576 [Podosphaera aphanis]
MALSSLLTTILEQAKEPLHCLNGAGYFTDEEWVKLDLILNKKQTWTKSSVKSKSEATSSQSSSSDRSKLYTRPEENPKPTAAKPSEVRVLTVAQSSDSDWDLAPEFYSPVVALNPIEPPKKTKAEPLDTPTTDKLLSSSTKFQPQESKDLHSGLMKGPPREIPPRISTPKNSTTTIAKPPAGVSTKISDQQISSLSKNERIAAILLAPIGPSDTKKRATQAPNPISMGGAPQNYQEDVNTFETRNAAEWDEAPPVQTNKITKKITSISTDRVVDKRAKVNTATHEVKVTTPSSSSSVARSVSSITTRSVSSATTRDPSTPLYRKEPKSTQETSPQAKTRICWYWAMSPAGCRHRPESCVNLHIKPTPGAIVDYPLNRSKASQNYNASAAKSKTCWNWATYGVCDKGEKKCEHAHGWVISGIAPRPKNMNMDRRLIHGVDQKLKVEKKLGKSVLIGNH